MERLMQLRQPAVVVTLVALVLHVVLSVASSLARPMSDPMELGFLATAVVEPLLLLLLTALLVICWLGRPTRAARALTVAALVLTGALSAALLGLCVVATIEMPWRDDDPEIDFYVWLLPSVTVAVISLMTQLTLLRRPVPQPAPELAAEAVPPEAWPDPDGEQEPPPDRNLQPGWDPDQAVGTVWRRAGDATTQTAATDWDEAGQSGDWSASEPRAEPPPESPRRTGI